ncbi:MAG: hypothetical protein EON54_01725, partial [Alcaligenaceae bacterium]
MRAVDTKPWNQKDLTRIAELGFPAAGLKIDQEVIKRLAIEASQSPQLMQAICLQICFTIGVVEVNTPIINRHLTAEELQRAFEETSTRTDFASLVRSMHAGPKVRGTERKEFSLSDETKGDVYRALLLAIRHDPPMLSFNWNELSRRVQRTCMGDSPQAASLSTACHQIAKMAKDLYPAQRVVDWEGDPTSLLSIEDPYFLFYLRWSDKMRSLATGGSA